MASFTASTVHSARANKGGCRRSASYRSRGQTQRVLTTTWSSCSLYLLRHQRHARALYFTVASGENFFFSPRIYGQQSAYCALSYRFHPYITKHTNPVCVKKPLTFRGYDDTPSIKAQGKTGERTRNNVPETARHWSRASTERCSEWAYPVRPR